MRVHGSGRHRGFPQWRCAQENHPQALLGSNRAFAYVRFCGICTTAAMELLVAVVGSYMCSLTPMIPATRPSNAFWATYLATFLLIAFSLATFAGRMTPEWLVSRSRWIERVVYSSACMMALLVVRLAMAAAVILYVAMPGAWTAAVAAKDPNNVVALAWFAVASYIGGFHTVALVGYAQFQSKHSTRYARLVARVPGFRPTPRAQLRWACQRHRQPCAFTSQIIFLAIQIGACVGLGLGAIPVVAKSS
jgi:hypothetical protein